MFKIGTYTNSFFSKAFLFATVMLLNTVLGTSQNPAVFNFENATKASEVSEQLAVGNTAPASMQKQYFIDPNSRLFDASELKTAYQEINGIRGFYSANRNAAALWEQTRNLLFSDKVTYTGKCESLSMGLLKSYKVDSKIDYKQKLEGVLSAQVYADLQFCLDYLGMTYSDWELWQAYVLDRKDLVNELKSFPRLSSRLIAFILAVDIRYTLCLKNDEVPCLVPALNQTENKQ